MCHFDWYYVCRWFVDDHCQRLISNHMSFIHHSPNSTCFTNIVLNFAFTINIFLHVYQFSCDSFSSFHFAQRLLDENSISKAVFPDSKLRRWMEIYQKYFHSLGNWLEILWWQRQTLHCTALAYGFVGKYPLEPIWNLMRLTMTLSKHLIEQLIWLENLSRKALRKSVINLPDLLIAIWDAIWCDANRLYATICICLINCSFSSYFYSLCSHYNVNSIFHSKFQRQVGIVLCRVFIQMYVDEILTNFSLPMHTACRSTSKLINTCDIVNRFDKERHRSVDNSINCKAHH